MPIINPSGGLGGGTVAIPLTVSAPLGATIVATNGTKTLSATFVEGLIMYLTDVGTWAITAELNGEKSPTEYVEVSDYFVILEFVPKPKYTASYTRRMASSYPASAAIGNYALVAGGQTDGDVSSTSVLNTVDAFNENGTRTSATALATARSKAMGASHNKAAIFAGGFIGGTYTSTGSYTKVVEAYDRSLTRTSLSSIGSSVDVCACEFGDIVIFAGGGTVYNSYSKSVVAFDADLVTHSLDALTEYASNMGGAANATYGFIGGGYKTASMTASMIYNSYVYAYDKDLTRYAVSNLPSKAMGPGVANVGQYVVFAGGWPSYNSAYLTTACAYDEFLVRCAAADLSVARYSIIGLSVPNFAVMLGGYASYGATDCAVDMYDSSLTMHVAPATGSLARKWFDTATVLNDSIFAFIASLSNTVDVYKA